MWMENFVNAPHTRMWPYVAVAHNPKRTRKILRTRLKKKKKWSSRKTLNSSIMKKTAADSKARGKKCGSSRRPSWLIAVG